MRYDNPSGLLRVGLVSDTHGVVRPELLRELAGVDLIVHAGDVGGIDVLDTLRGIAPVHAVYGNTDVPTHGLPATVTLEVGKLRLQVTHGHELGAPTAVKLAERYDADVIVYGHTHRAAEDRIGRQLVINPGAAGPGRFRLVPSCAVLTVHGDEADVDIRALV